VPVLTAEERKTLAEAVTKLDEAEKQFDGDVSTNTARTDRVSDFNVVFAPVEVSVASVVGAPSAQSGVRIPISDGSLRPRLEKSAGRGSGEGPSLYREDPQAREALKRAARVRELNAHLFSHVEQSATKNPPDVPAAKAEIRKLREEVVLLYAMGDLPADNVRNLGLVLYSEHLLAVELAGTLLLVAVIGAIAVAHRKGVAR
jgi:hypothetical protein